MVSRLRLFSLVLALAVIITVLCLPPAFGAEGKTRYPWEIWNYDKEKPVRGVRSWRGERPWPQTRQAVAFHEPPSPISPMVG